MNRRSITPAALHLGGILFCTLCPLLGAVLVLNVESLRWLGWAQIIGGITLGPLAILASRSLAKGQT